MGLSCRIKALERFFLNATAFLRDMRNRAGDRFIRRCRFRSGKPLRADPAFMPYAPRSRLISTRDQPPRGQAFGGLHSAAQVFFSGPGSCGPLQQNLVQESLSAAKHRPVYLCSRPCQCEKMKRTEKRCVIRICTATRWSGRTFMTGTTSGT